MKKLCYVLVAITGLLYSLPGCQDVRVGFLETSLAEYTPDSLVVKAQLDPTLDADRIKYKYPWVTLSIEGVEGTSPMIYQVHDVVATEGGDGAALLQNISIANSGVMQIPWNHTVPPGRYSVAIEITNEGYSHVLNDVYTFIVK